MELKIKAKTNAIQKARVEQGLTQVAAAKHLEILSKYLSSIEVRGRSPSPELAKRICQLLNKEFSEIFEFVKVRRKEK